MHDQDNQRPQGCSDCGAFPTTTTHRCPPTTPAELEQLVDDLEAKVAAEKPHADRDGSEQPYNESGCGACSDPQCGGPRCRHEHIAHDGRGRAQCMACGRYDVVHDERVRRFAEAIDPEAFDEAKKRSQHPASVVQWAARRHMAVEAARAAVSVANVEHEALRASLEKAWAERDEVAGRLSALLCDLTAGRLSKTTYDVPTMVAAVDSAYDDAQQDDLAERDRLAEKAEAEVESHQRQVGYWRGVAGDQRERADRLAGVVERVRALAADLRARSDNTKIGRLMQVSADMIDQAIDADAPETSEERR